MTENTIEFVNGLIVKAPREGAPDFVKASISLKREELIAWLGSKEGDWINIDVKESKAGKWYASVDNWKADKEYFEKGKETLTGHLEGDTELPDHDAEDINPEDIPF